MFTEKDTWKLNDKNEYDHYYSHLGIGTINILEYILPDLFLIT